MNHDTNISSNIDIFGPYTVKVKINNYGPILWRPLNLVSKLKSANMWNYLAEQRDSDSGDFHKENQLQI